LSCASALAVEKGQLSSNNDVSPVQGSTKRFVQATDSTICFSILYRILAV
jgi:hypothetical protein